MRASTWMLVGLIALGTACQKSEKPQGVGATQGSTTPLSTASAAASDDGEGVATEEDFEDEAEQKISHQNADEELDKLEKEISN